MLSLLLLVAVPQLSAEGQSLQRDLLDEAARQLDLRDKAGRDALVDRGVSEEYYYRCVRSRKSEGLRGAGAIDACVDQYMAVRRRAIVAEVSLMGVKFDRLSVQRYLSAVAAEARGLAQ